MVVSESEEDSIVERCRSNGGAAAASRSDEQRENRPAGSNHSRLGRLGLRARNIGASYPDYQGNKEGLVSPRNA